MTRRAEAKDRSENEVEFARIVAFSDGVFAIAITLLVLGLDVAKGLPSDELWGTLGDLWDNFLAYAISFAVIGRFWVIHHRFFGEVRAFDNRLLSLNLFYLAAIVLIPFSSKVLGEYGSDAPAVVVYAANLAAVVLIGLWMTAYAHRAGLTATAPADQRENRIRAAYIAAIFLVSIPVAFAAPNASELLWLALFLDPSQRLARRARPGSP